ncbi:MAG: MerC family mercury resistance protein [Candidatus Omnitrophica bacterium]|nr:MerC family mercury resistance protein [Candidatus Omnitrophota bacterium]
MSNNTSKPKWLAQIASVFSALVAIVCPLCIPALGAFLASIGLGFAVRVSFLQPFLIILLLISLGSLAWSARLHKQWWILLIGVVGAFGIYAGRYIWFSLPLMYGGAFLLIGISIVNFKLKLSCGCKQ